MTAQHKAVLFGLIVGALAMWFWQRRAGKPAAEGG